MSAEFTGRWVLRGGIRVPIVVAQPEPKKRERPKPADPVTVLVAETVWTDEALMEAHRRHWHGFRDVWTLAGNREWDRRRKATTRARLAAGGMSATDLAWATTAAVRGSWVLDCRQNRASVSNTTI